MGVPLATSVGTNKNFPDAIDVPPLKPYGVFRTLDHLPLDDRIAAYHKRLDRGADGIAAGLTNLTESYPGHPLVLLCYCHLAAADTGPMGCHRRWAAVWFEERYSLHVPELSAAVTSEVEPDTLW